MTCRGALVYRLVLCLVPLVLHRVPLASLPAMVVEVVTVVGVVMLLVCHVRFSFPRLRLVLRNARPVFRSMTISDARVSFVDVSHVRVNRRRVRTGQGRR